MELEQRSEEDLIREHRQLLDVITRIDTHLATAKAFPRSRTYRLTEQQETDLREELERASTRARAIFTEIERRRE